MTMNKGSKMKADWKNILKNETMLLSHTRTANFISRVRVSMHKLADSKKANKHVHKENKTGWLKADEKGVQDLANCFAEFECDPFDSTHTVVMPLHFREVASVKLEEDFATAHTQGEKLVADFFKERIFSRDKEFDTTMHRNSQGSFTNQPTSEKNSNPMQNKTVEMENKAMTEVVSLSAEKKVSLEEIINHQITNECLSIFNTNGSMVKKSKLVQMLNWKEIPDWQMQTYISVVVVGFLWRLAAPSTEDKKR